MFIGTLDKMNILNEAMQYLSKEKSFSISVIYNRKRYMCMVASWACEVTEILTQRSTDEASFVWGLGPSRTWPYMFSDGSR